MIDLIVDNLTEILKRILEYSDPEYIIEERVRFDKGKLYVNDVEHVLDGFDRITLLGFGKASVGMANKILDIFGDRVDEGYVITYKGSRGVEKGGVKTFYGDHPIPDEDTIEYSRYVFDKLLRLGKRDLLITLISGGGSSLFEVPYMHLRLQDIAVVWRNLLDMGANISELNTVRRHLSSVKGGRLAEALYPKNIISLIISDVPGDMLHDIASGPTAPDPTYYYDAYRIVRGYGFPIRMRAVRLLRDGIYGKYRETPKEGNPAFENTYNHIIANTPWILGKIGKYLDSQGLKTMIVDGQVMMRVEEAAKHIVERISNVGESNTIFLFGGEVYSRVVGRGIGGPNQELLLHLYRLFRERGLNCEIVTMATDGVDGNSPSAGGYIDMEEYDIPEKEIEEYLSNSDSYSLLKKYGLAIETGPTGTNIGDIWIISVKE